MDGFAKIGVKVTTRTLFAAACLARHPERGARFDSVALRTGGARAARAAGERVLRIIHQPELARGDELWRDGDPLGHLAYYADPSRLDAFDFLDRAPGGTPADIEGFEPWVTPLWEADALPAVARAWWDGACALAWGPVSLVLCPANPHPHPIA